jgi:hypothetical protein
MQNDVLVCKARLNINHLWNVVNSSSLTAVADLEIEYGNELYVYFV